MHRLIRLTLLLLAAARPAAAGSKLAVVATTADLGALGTAVGGDAVSVTVLARPTEDPHFVDAKPSFIRLLNQADVLLEGGAGLEAGWLPPLLDGARNARIALGTPGRVVAATGLSLLEVPSQLDRSMGDVHPYGNPHFLLDPENAKTVARAIAEAFCAADGPRCETYRQHAGALAATLDQKLAEWQKQLAAVKGAKVVTYHKDFDYFARRFGLEVVDTLEPKPGIPPSPAHLAELVPKMEAAHVRLILVESFRERQTPAFVAEKTGAKVLTLPLMPDGDYVGLIDRNVSAVAGALAR